MNNTPNPAVNILVMILMVGFGTTAAALDKREPYVPAMFVFGDSLADAGNNDYIPNCTILANFIPYGVSYFHYPTGRFTNGRTVFDFIASLLGLPGFIPPYLQPNNIISLSHQISYFEHYSRGRIGQKERAAWEQAKSYFAKSLYCISIGSNDIGLYVRNLSVSFNATIPQHQFVASLVGNFQRYIARLYRAGARNFLVLDVSAVGCTPVARYYHGECVQIANDIAVAYNTALKQLVDKLNRQLDGAYFILLDSFNYLMHMIEFGEIYGFSNTRWACCGSGMFNVEEPCGKTTPAAKYCNETSEYLFWDGAHPTQTVYGIFSREIWTGNWSVMHPFNLSTLVLRSGI